MYSKTEYKNPYFVFSIFFACSTQISFIGRIVVCGFMTLWARLVVDCSYFSLCCILQANGNLFESQLPRSFFNWSQHYKGGETLIVFAYLLFLHLLVDEQGHFAWILEKCFIMNQTLLPSSVLPKDLNTITYKELHFPIMSFTYFPFTF